MGAACANAKSAQELPRIQVLPQNDQEPVQKSNSSEQATTTRKTVLSKQVSNISSDGLPARRTSHKQTLASAEKKAPAPQGQPTAVNPGREQLLKQREFVLSKFLSELQIVEKTILNDLVQLFRNFLSHLESSTIYWCKVWLINKNEYSIIVGYSNNVGEVRKIRILYTKQLELASYLLDNYFYFQQFSCFKIFDYNFRLNKRHQNFYIFSEQEYCETCLEQCQIELEDIDPLLRYLLGQLNEMHRQGYVHAGIKPSNIYQFLSPNFKKLYKLDISFQAYKYGRRNHKSKELRLNQLNDLEDVAITIINLFFKGQEVRQQLKQKSLDFQGIVNQLYQSRKEQLSSQIKEIMALLHRSKQLAYDLKSDDFQIFLGAAPCAEIPELKTASQILFYYEEDYVQFYQLTSVRNQKSLTSYQLITPQGQPAKIIPGSAYIEDKTLYFAYEDMIACIDIKFSNEIMEDTIEIFQMVLRQVLAGIEKQRERVDSASPSYQLYINQHSPTTQVGDQFKFNNITSKNINKSFHDRTYFSQQNVAELFTLMAGEKERVTVDQLLEFFAKFSDYIDNALLQMLIPEKLEELFSFFGDKRLTVKEFEQIFRFKSKQHLPTYQKVVKSLKNTPSVQRFIIFNNTVYYYDGYQLHFEDQSIELEFNLTHLLRHENSLMLAGEKNGFLFISNLQQCSTQTTLKVLEKFGLVRFGQNLLGVLLPNELLIYQIKQERVTSLQVDGLSLNSNPIVKDCMILFLSRDRFVKVFFSKHSYATTSSEIFAALQEWGRFESKLKVRVQQRSNSQSDEQIGAYQVQKQHYPQQLLNVCQFRLLSVTKDGLKFMLIQRIVYGEYESIDDSYAICKYLDKWILDFFLTIDGEGRTRLNYVVDNAEILESRQFTWHLLKRCVKALYQLKLNSIYVQEMHPTNILVYQDRVLFTTLISKNNFPSIFSERNVPIVGTAEYMDPKLFQGLSQSLFYNQIFHHPGKSNVYSLGMIFLRQLTQYSIKSTKEQSLYLMEIAQAIQQLNCSHHMKTLIEELLKENEEQRQDSWGILQMLKRIQERNKIEIYLPRNIQYLMMESVQVPLSVGVEDNHLLKQSEAIGNLPLNMRVLNVLILDGNHALVLTNRKMLHVRLQPKQTEIVNFQQIVDDEEEVHGKTTTVALNLDIVKEVEVPIFELQRAASCPMVMSGEEVYFFGYGLRDRGSSDCFTYIAKRSLFKRIGQRSGYFDAQVMELNEVFYLLQKESRDSKILCGLIQKQQFQSTVATIKIKQAGAMRWFFYKYQVHVLALSCQPLVAYLLNVDALKAIALKVECQMQELVPIGLQSSNCLQLMTKQGIVQLSLLEDSVLKLQLL